MDQNQNFHVSQFWCLEIPKLPNSLGKVSEGVHYSKQQQNTQQRYC